ncbi:hypothetical protein ACHQM5_021064 [Ranunculus cassubicifolius]
MNDFSSNLEESNMWWMNTPKSSSHHIHSSQQNTSSNNGPPWGPPYHSEAASTVEDEQEADMIEHMFEKPLTPSDVGKLNRLVIPKQHAEKYFPLSRLDSVEKGLLLSFEDELGKQWRFRYSYWNSSQSYVLTKGWSRFVKEKQLDAGDVVSFERRKPDGQTLYIRWRRRVPPPPVAPSSNTNPPWTRVYYSAHPPYPSHLHTFHGPLYHDHLHAAAAVQPGVEQPVAAVKKKQVRLFGVNLDCQLDEPEAASPDVSSYSNNGPAHFLNHNFQQDFNFSREYYQTRNYSGGSGENMPI